MVAILVAVLVAGTGSQTHAASGPTATPSSSDVALATDDTASTWTADPYLYATPSPSPSPTATPTLEPEASDTPETEPTPTPFVAKGWPVIVDGGLDAYSQGGSGQILAARDGTTYITGLPGLDASGHVRAKWLKLPSGDAATAVAVGSDGTTYAIDDTESSDGHDGSSDAESTATQAPVTGTMLYGYAANGKVRAGWPVDVGESPSFEAGPGGTLYVFSTVKSMIKVTVLTSAGKVKAGWALGSSQSGSCGHAIRSDGTLFYAYAPAEYSTCSVLVFGPKGNRISAGPVRSWNGLTMGPDGTVVAYAWDDQPYNSSVTARTRLAVIGTDGLPAAGWPVYIEGPASIPALASDGTIYAAQAGVGTQPSRVIAYDKAGAIKAGWPVTLPEGYGPFAGGGVEVPLSPVVRPDGTVYIAATNSDWMGSLIALDPSGNVVPGWPYVLPQAFADLSAGGDSPDNPGPVYARLPSGRGLLYLVLDGEIVALADNGSLAPGWPLPIPQPVGGKASWVDCAVTVDGGLVVVSQVDRDEGVVGVVTRVTPDGKTKR